MLRWRQIRNGIVSVDVGKAHNSEPFYWTTFYYYKGVIIDTGCPHTAEESVTFLSKKGFDIQVVLLTHSHEDHSGGAHLIQERFGVDVYAPPKSAEILLDPPEIPLYRQKVWGQPEPVKVRPLEETMRFGELEFSTLNTPGHSSDHVSFLTGRTLFVGDLIANLTPVIIMKHEDYIDLIDSLRVVLKQDFETAYGGHGSWKRDSVSRNLDNILRMKRDVEALHNKGLTAAQIVEELLSSVSDKVLMMEELSEFEWSRKNLIESLLGHMHT